MDLTFITFALSVGCIAGSYLILWRMENLIMQTEANIIRMISDLSSNDKNIADAINEMNCKIESRPCKPKKEKQDMPQ